MSDRIGELSHLLVGFTKCKVIAINPTGETLEKILGEIPNKNPLYHWTNAEGIKKCKIDAYLEDTNENIFRHTMYLSEESEVSKNGAYKWVSCAGDYQWADGREQLWDKMKFFEKTTWDNGKPLSTSVLGPKENRVARKGETDLIHFRKMLTDTDVKDIHTNLFYDIDRLLTGDISEIEQDVKLHTKAGEYHFIAFLYVDDDLKQRVWKEFLPCNMLGELNKQVFSIYSRTKWTEWKKNVENEYYGLKGHYVYTRLKTFEKTDFRNKKQLNPEVWEY